MFNLSSSIKNSAYFGKVKPEIEVEKQQHKKQSSKFSLSSASRKTSNKLTIDDIYNKTYK